MSLTDDRCVTLDYRDSTRGATCLHCSGCAAPMRTALLRYIIQSSSAQRVTCTGIFSRLPICF